MADPLLSDSTSVVAGALTDALARDVKTKKEAVTGVDYYEGRHDILENRIFYMDDHGHLKEDDVASNIRIPHQFLTELIDQKVAYILGCPVEVDCEDPAFKEALDEYYDEEFNVFLQDFVAGASKKGAEYCFARTGADDRIRFQVSDYIKTFSVYDESLSTVRRVVRYYTVDRLDANRKPVKVTKAEVWDDQQVWFYTKLPDKPFTLDSQDTVLGGKNPRKHVLAQAPDGELAGRGYGFIPFYEMKNNDDRLTDLHPIKRIIDDYDLMNAFLSNNLQDFSEAILVVSGFTGQDLSVLRRNLRATKTVGVGEGGDVNVRTFDVPVDGRKAKMDIDWNNVYVFGQGYDSTQVGDGNITNVVIKSRYARLDLKANRAETRLRAALQWINDVVVRDINRRRGTSYNPSDVTFTLTRSTPVNEVDNAQVAFTEAQTTAVRVNAALAAASRLDDETTLRLLCDVLALDYDDVSERVTVDAVVPSSVRTHSVQIPDYGTPPPQQDATPGTVDSIEEAQTLKAQSDAMGVMIRAGADPDEAAARAGLGQLTFTGQPVSVRSEAQVRAQTVEAQATAAEAAAASGTSVQDDDLTPPDGG